MKRCLLLFVLVLVVFSSAALGFDGGRKGFVLGGGIGFSPVSGWDIDDSLFGFFPLKASEGNAGFGMNIFLGYSWDEKNMIVYEFNGVGYQSDKLNQNLAQGFQGPTWYHYWGNTGSSAFTTIGVGLYTFKPENTDALDPGPGLLLGVGYEFTRHFQAGLYLGVGTISEIGVDMKLTQISILINAVAF